ncbi:hypothetical protein ACFX11_024685 [Malus domestica]
MAYVNTNEVDGDHIWFLDLGYSNHMYGKRDMFSDFDNNFRESVNLGNDLSLIMLGKGNIRMEIKGMIQVVTGVFYVPELKNNLLSIRQLQEKGLAVLMQHGKCKIFHPEKGLITKTEMSCNQMFVVLAQCPSKEQRCLSSLAIDQSQLWHCRYGHLSWNGLKILQQKKMVDGLPQIKAHLTVCENCLVGRKPRDPFPKESIWRVFETL